MIYSNRKLILLNFIFLFLSISTLTGSNNDLKLIQGNVSDKNGVPLIGVNVRIEDGKTGVITDVNGQYKINVPKSFQKLLFSYIGFISQEADINNNSSILNITMLESADALDEVVVVGYGVQKKVSVLGSISNVSVKEIKKSSTPSISNTLGGQIPGLITRQSSGEPGYDAATVYIRGMGTWVNRNPLVLIDGIERDMNTINTEEIESISVLKDASATAVYGVQGANGVILITTKKGQIGKPKVTLRTEYAILTPQRLPNYINGSEYASLVNEGRINVNKNPKFISEEIEKFKNNSDPYLYPNVDWVNEIIRQNSMQSISNLNISGGNDNVQYFVNVGFTTQDGIWKVDNLNKYNTNANLKRYNFRSRTDVKVSQYITAKLGIGGIIQMQNFPGKSANDIFSAIRITSPIAFPKENPDGSMSGLLANLGSNPWGLITQSGYETQNSNSLQSTFELNWDLSKITSGLSINGRFSYDHFFKAYTNRKKDFEVKQYLGKDANGVDIFQTHREATPLGYSLGGQSNRAIYQEFSINYNRNFGKHSINSLLLYNARDFVDITASTSINNLPYRRQGIAGRGSYNFDQRYLMEFNFGYNGSEQFPVKKRYGFFPSLSLGWIPTNESFWNMLFVNSLKIRASCGQVGNDISGNRRYMYLTSMQTQDVESYRYGDSQVLIPGIQEGQIGASNVTWETSTKFNVGLEGSFLKDLITFQLDYFIEDREGILIQRQTVPNVAGFFPWVLPYGNLGIVNNKGLDGSFEIKKSLKSGLFFSVRGNLSFAKNYIVENDEPTPKFAYQSLKGKSIDQPFGLIALGFFKDDKDIEDSPKQTFMTTVRPGDIKYMDQNGDRIIDSYDKVPIGFTRMPEIMYGFGGTVSYKNFDISMFFTGAARTSIFIDGATMYPFEYGEASWNVLREYYDNRWTSVTKETAKYPAVVDGPNPNNYQTSTLYMRDGSYLKLRNIEIGYNLPKNIYNTLHINGLRVFVNGMNIYSWDKIKIFDPESNNGTGSYPVSRTTNCGIQVNF